MRDAFTATFAGAQRQHRPSCLPNAEKLSLEQAADKSAAAMFFASSLVLVA